MRGSKLAQPWTIARRCLRLSSDVDHKQDRPAECRRHAGGRACPVWLSRHAIEEPHQAFAEDQLAGLTSGVAKRAEQRWGHRPTVEIEAVSTGRGGVERGIDIIRPAFGAGDGETRVAEGAHEAESQHGLAAARARRGDYEPACPAIAAMPVADHQKTCPVKCGSRRKSVRADAGFAGSLGSIPETALIVFVV